MDAIADSNLLQARHIALVGNPNCGKTALFNLLTGSRQKVANYAGVTVERKEGRFVTPDGRRMRVLDLPGTYSLQARSPDEQITCDVLHGRLADEPRPELAVCVVDATNLRRNLRFVLAVKRLGVPMVVALNMVDMARKQGLNIDADALARELGVPVVPTVAVQHSGADALRAVLDVADSWTVPGTEPVSANAVESDTVSVADDHAEVQHILAVLGLDHTLPNSRSDSIDRVVLHPVAGPLILLAVLFLIFQAVFAWAEWPMSLIETGTAALGNWLASTMSESLLRSLLVDGIIAGLGGVIVFLPQIVILFFFILVLEESGYLPRAAFLLDRLMGGVGLSGRSFIPLLSSFACAIPGIMAARTIQNPRDRWVTIMIAPLMTCSARLPVYALLIGAFIPQREVWGGLSLQGLVLFGLYFAGIIAALAVAWVLKRLTAKGQTRQLLMELPTYHLPAVRNIAIGLWQRVVIFLSRVGGIILALTILLWFLSTFPAPPAGATGPAIDYSYAGYLGRLLSNIFEPIGFNWQISIALVPGLAAREVAVSALGTVYALSATDDAAAQLLTPIIASQWSLATALSLLVWYVFAPQCLSTIATVKRETGGWKAPLIMTTYLFALAYLASFITYRVAVAFGAG
ncbi:ferrous iron transport protein B [Permianibacter sp. IMCC34836]|nr:ferrous iron transport protein B [Permianibacter fluminis]NQD36788.1 ferrous iron transport protein B [Permianibacter fluminis]